MKVALVVHDFDPKVGHGRYCVELARRFSPRHAVTVYANRFAVDPEPGWEFVRVPAWRRVSLASVFTFLVASERLVRRGGHDIVHGQGMTCWKTDVITAHICNVARYRIAPPTRFKARLFPLLVNPFESAFYRQRHARHVIAISRQVAGEIQECYGWRRPISVIHHGVDSEVFRPSLDPAERLAARERYGLAAADWVWLFVGEAVKGLRGALEQLPHFPTARLLAISRSNGAEYEALASNLGVKDRFRFWGPEREIWRAYRAADVFLYPSTYDTFGMVVSEAMATGVPVVVGRDIGAAELIENGRNGFLIRPSEPDDLRAALQRLLVEPVLARAVGDAGRATAQAQSWDACARATEQVYGEVMKAKQDAAGASRPRTGQA